MCQMTTIYQNYSFRSYNSCLNSTHMSVDIRYI